MSKIAIANRYAQGLMDALPEAQRNAAMQALELVTSLFSLDEARAILKSPVMPPELKTDLLKYASSDHAKEGIFMNFLSLLVEANRVELIPEINDAFKGIIRRSQGIELAEVVSAVKLPDDVLEDIKSLSQRLTENKLEIETSVDSSLLGGFKVNIGNKRLDLSLKSKLDALTSAATR